MSPSSKRGRRRTAPEKIQDGGADGLVLSLVQDDAAVMIGHGRPPCQDPDDGTVRIGEFIVRQVRGRGPADVVVLAPDHLAVDPGRAECQQLDRPGGRGIGKRPQARPRQSSSPTPRRFPRRRPSSGVSPGSSFPPGNSHTPAEASSRGAGRMSTRPSRSITAAVTRIMKPSYYGSIKYETHSLLLPQY